MAAQLEAGTPFDWDEDYLLDENMSQAGEIPSDGSTGARIPHIPNEIWMKVIEIFEADWRAEDYSGNYRSFAFQTLVEISVVNSAFRYYAQSVLFRNVMFWGCFSPTNYEKFGIITQPHIARHVQELYVNATMMCTQTANTHQPLKSPIKTSMGGSPTRQMMSHTMQLYLEENAKQRMRLLLGMCCHSIKKLTLFARDQHPEDLNTERRGLIAIWSFNTAMQVFRTMNFPNLKELSLIVPDDAQALWDLSEELVAPAFGGRYNELQGTICQRNLERLTSLKLFFKHDFKHVGKLLSLLDGSKLDILEIQLGYCDYQPYCPVKLPGVRFHSFEVAGYDNVTNLGLERLLVDGKLSDAIAGLTRLTCLDFIEVQLGLEGVDDTWANVLETCVDASVLPFLVDVRLRRVGYTCKTLARCGIWNTTVHPKDGRTHGRAMCTANSSDIRVYDDAIVKIEERKAKAGISPSNPNIVWNVCRHRVWLSK